MWRYLRDRAYSLSYYLGKTPPSPTEISAQLDRLATTSSKAANADLCDCQVLAAGNTIDCKSSITTYACEFIGDNNPGLTSIPLPLGSCKNLPKSGAR